MHFRKRSVKNEKTTEDGEIPEHLIPQPKTKANAPILSRIDINRAIIQLPPGYRAVFILHDVEGFEHSEVAKILGVSIGTSKSQLHKARLKLRGLLMKKSLRMMRILSVCLLSAPCGLLVLMHPVCPQSTWINRSRVIP